MNDRWKLEYSPLSHIDDSIYDALLFAPTDEEWSSTLKSLPNGKAAGISGIPYELLKHLPDDALKYLKEIVSLCFASSHIPSEWKEATIYPIPNPPESHCYLKNTHPITLLDTARKLMTRSMNNRLCAILSQHKVMKGNNYAGLPGCSCDPPIALLENIMNDAKTNNKPLFVFLQDISKAFDSMDPRMLRLAMARLKIPSTFINLTFELFTNRYNTVITAFGPTKPYQVQIGIDQGESLSPLLWVIYLDPLLTVLNRENPSPYSLNSNPDISLTNTSTLCFMDDTTLISSDCEGLTRMLSIAQEFYDLNNTKINFNKATLICNRNPDNIHEYLASSPSAHTFTIDATRQFTITPITPYESFRFLGVWFTLSMTSALVKKQCRTEYALFASKLHNKKLTSDQLSYLHNAVLLPRVEYRLKATCLTEQECLSIQAPFRKLLKNTLALVSSLPNAFLHYRSGLNIISLFQRHLTNHISNLTSIFSSDNSSAVFSALSHRLSSIQKDINMPYSPLLLTDFSCFIKTKCFRTDLVFRILFFSNNLGISFARPQPASQNVNNHTPLFLYFVTIRPCITSRSRYSRNTI